MELFIVINAGLFLYTAVLLVFRKPALRRDALSRRLASISAAERNNLYLDEDLDKPIMERLIRPFAKAMLEKLSRFVPQRSKQVSRQNTKLKANLIKAGLGIGASEYQLYRGMYIAALTAMAAIISLLAGFRRQFFLLSALGGLYIGYATTRYHLTHRISTRRKAMEQQLPDVLDLLSVNVEAGLGFEQAVAQVIGHMQGPIVDELTVAYR
jgi:tight adherence protein C